MSFAAPAIRRTFSSLSVSRNFRLYFFGQIISASGTWVNATATSWLVLRITGSGVALGVNTALLFLPMLVLGAWGGVLADRFDKRRILIGTQAAFAVTSLVLFALVGTGAIELWMVYVLSFVDGLMVALDNPTRQSFYAEMVGSEHVSNAVSLNSAAFTGSRIIGPAIAGILIATVGLATCFVVDGISYLAVLIALVAMRPRELRRVERSSRERGHLVAGLRYVWRTDELRRPLLVMAVIFTLAFNFAVLLPLLAEETFHTGAGAFGMLSALAGVGSFAAAIWAAARNREPSMLRLAVFAVALGVALIVVSTAPTFPLALAGMAMVGMTAMAFMITGNTMLQVHAAPRARGRVMALYGVVFLGSTPIGSPIAGWVAEHLGPRWGLALGGVVALALGFTLLMLRYVRDARDVRRDTEHASVAPVIVVRPMDVADEVDQVPLSA